MKNESPISYDLKVMTNVKIFVHATNADADADNRAMTLRPGSLKSENYLKICG